MLALNVEALKQKVSKAISKLPDTVDAYRNRLNDLKETTGEDFVTQLTGQYYKSGRGSVFVTVNMSDSGTVKNRQPEKFMTLIDDSSRVVREGDCFMHRGVKYKIVDLGNTLNVYFDMSLERV